MIREAKHLATSVAHAANIPTAMPKSNKEWQRVVLWSFWAVNMLIDIVYMGLSFATSVRLSKHLSSSSVSFESDTWRAPIAASVLGPLMVLTFNVMSCVVLIRKSINKTGPSFGYGFIMAWCFMMSFYCLLCGLVLGSFSSTALKEQSKGTGWTQYYTEIYHSTVVCNYICAALFILFFLALVIFQGGISKHLNMFDAATDRKRQLELAAIAKASQQAHAAGGGI